MSSTEFRRLCDNPNIDCNDLAENLLRANGGNGKIIEIKGLNGRDLITPEGADTIAYQYHQAFVSNGLVYDPRLSPNPISLGDFLKRIRELNPGGIDVTDYLP